MLSKEDKLEVLALVGQAINQKGGLVVQGNIIGNGGILQAITPVEVIRETGRKEILEAVNERIREINANLPIGEVTPREYRYIFNKTIPMQESPWALADVGDRVGFDKKVNILRYCQQTNEFFLNFEGEKIVRVLSGDDFLEKTTFLSSHTIYDFKLTVDGQRVVLDCGGSGEYRVLEVWNRVFGTFTLAQTFNVADGGYDYFSTYFSFSISSNGEFIIGVGHETNSKKETVVTYKIKFGKYRRTKIEYRSLPDYKEWIGNNGIYASWVSYDNEYFYSCFKQRYNYVKILRYKLNSDREGYVYDAEFQIPDWDILPKDFAVSADELRLFISNGSVFHIYKQLTSIVEQTDPFGDGSMKAKYFAYDNLTNFVDSNKFNMVEKVGHVIYESDSEYGKSLVFDGNNLLAIQNTQELETQDFTIAFNFKTPQLHANDNYMLAVMAVDAEAKARGFKISEKNGKVLFYHGSGDSSWEIVETDDVVLDDKFHHIAVTVLSGGVIKIYIDGHLVKTQTVDPATISYLNSTNEWSVGGRGENSGEAADLGEGHINLLQVFSRPLTPDEIVSVKTQSKVQPGRYELEQEITVPEGRNGGWFCKTFTGTYDFRNIWFASKDDKAITKYTAMPEVILYEPFSSDEGWTLDANTTIDTVNHKMIMDHTAGDNEATHAVNHLDIKQYNITLEYTPSTTGKLIVEVGDVVEEFTLNDTGSETKLIAVTDATNKTFKIKTDNTCNAEVYEITKIILDLA